jgi:beta-galactosidase
MPSGLWYGADYNPEQWPERVWVEDVALMREAGVNLVTVNVFGWASIEPAPGEYDFARLDRVLDLVYDGGIAVDLATATAAPPPWFSLAHPQVLPVDAAGQPFSYGSRQAICASSPVYRSAAVGLATTLADRYTGHPALAMWHVHNEYGCHAPQCFCDVSTVDFRDWLRRRYADLEGLNAAWGTNFWSQRFTDWEQVQPPRRTVTFPNPGQVLDWRRFCTDAQLACFVAERDVIERLSPGVPVTTNLMAGNMYDLDYWAWSAEMTGGDRWVSNDHYLIGDDPREPGAQVAFAADLSRGIAQGAPWLLMEHSTSAVNWQPRNYAKKPGQLRRDSLSHVARGSEGALFFQWRASRAGAEKWHSAMLPHAGTGSAVWRSVVALGADLRSLAEVRGSRVVAEVAVLLDYPSVWAQEAPAQPSADLVAYPEVQRWHAALWRAGVTADVVHPSADLSPYRLVVAPSLYLVSDSWADNLASFVDGGGALVVGPYSGLVDPHDRVRPAPLPGAFASLLGIRVEEHLPLRPGETVRLSDGSLGSVWSEALGAPDAVVERTYPDGSPAVTRRGTAWYVSTRLDDPSLGALLAQVAGGSPYPPGVDGVRRVHPDGRSYLFLFNHGRHDAQVAVAGTDLLTGARWPSPTTVPAGGVVVLDVVPAA